MDFVVEMNGWCLLFRGRPKRTWKEVVEGDMKTLKLKEEDVLGHGKQR